ncbi:MAG TPA: hypothetical protein VNC50_22280, partial [Planctomycetia bacterium]|nr:hypothetical protein [Planctomycetia bacterium]
MSWTILLMAAAVAPGSRADSPTADYATTLRLAGQSGAAPISENWALPYLRDSAPVEMPVQTDLPGDAFKPVTQEGEDPNADTSQYPPGTPPGFVLLNGRTVDDLSLDWGLAQIGPGVLTPLPPFGSSGGGGSPGGCGLLITKSGEP